MVADELLNGLYRCFYKFFVCFRVHLLDFLQVVQADVLVAIGLDVTRYDTPFEACRMDKVAVLTASVAVWSMVITTGDGAKVAWLDYQLASLKHGLL